MSERVVLTGEDLKPSLLKEFNADPLSSRILAAIYNRAPHKSLWEITCTDKTALITAPIGDALSISASTSRLTKKADWTVAVQSKKVLNGNILLQTDFLWQSSNPTEPRRRKDITDANYDQWLDQLWTDITPPEATEIQTTLFGQLIRSRLTPVQFGRLVDYVRKHRRTAVVVGAGIGVGALMMTRETKNRRRETTLNLAPDQIAAYENFYTRSWDRAVAFICKRIHDESESEAIVAAVFTSMLNNWHSYGRQPSEKIQRIMFSSLANRWHNWHRDRRRLENNDDENIDGEQIPSSDRRRPVEDEVLSTLIRHESPHGPKLVKMIAHLDDRARSVLILKLSTDFINEEIGRILGTSEGAVKSLYFRITKELAKQLQS